MQKYFKLMIVATITILILFTLLTVLYTIMGYKRLTKRGERTADNHIAPIVSDPHVKTERKLNIIASQLDAITTRNVHDTIGGKVPSHLTNRGFYLSAEALYLKANEDGLEYGLLQETLPSSGRTIEDIDNLDISFHWHFGYRLGVGYTFGHHDQWDVYANWTTYNAHGKGKEHAYDTDELLIPEWSPGFLGTSATNASASWELHYNTLDLELGRDYFISRAIALRPHVGIRGAWVDQDYDAKYVTTANPTKMDAKNKFDAGGLRTGANFLWHFINYRWGVFAQFSASLLYGRFDVQQDYTALKTGGIAVAPFLEAHRHFMRVRTNLEGAIGLQYETYTRSHGHLSISLGYEIFEWFNQNQLTNLIPITAPSYIGETKGGDLGMQGVSFKLKYNF